MKPLALGFMSRPVEFRRRFYLSVAAIGFCPMGDTPALLGEIAMWKFLPDVLPAGAPLDLSLPKTSAEFLVAGSAFAPGRQAVRSLAVSVRLGTLARRIVVVGDRHIEGGLPTEPLPFTEMPLGWDRAYGGRSHAQNPLGRGIEEMPIPGVGHRVALPNILPGDGTTASGRPEPVNLGPVDFSWPQRSSLAGTHDQRWLEEDFPGFARDIDFRMAMAAQPEQRFEGFLAGDEDYAIANMHPEEPEITGRLPGIRPRILIRRQGSEALEEVPLAFTTVWFFPAQKRLVTIHHGRVQVAEEDARDITLVMLGADRIGAPRPVAAFEAVAAARLDPEGGMLASLDDAALVPTELMVPDPELEALRARHQEEGLLQKRGQRRAELEYERNRARLRERGIDPASLGIAPPTPGEPLPPLEGLPGHITRKKAELERKHGEAEAQLAEQQDAIDARTVALGGTPVARQAKPAGPPRYSAAALRTEFEAKAAATEAAGLDAGEMRRLLGDPDIARRWTDGEEAARNGYRAGADQQDPAPRLDAAANAALRARLLDGSRGGARLDLCGADLSGLDLSGFDLTEAWLDGADLRGTNLTGARLPRAVLAHAKLEGAVLVQADLREANLGRACLTGADLSGARLTDAILRAADLRGATLRRAQLKGAQLMEARMEGLDLGEALAPGILLNEAALSGLRAAGAMLEGATFVKAVLDGADFTGAVLRGASFIGVQAEGLVFDGALLDRAVFVEACALRGARFAGARIEAANLRGAALDGAVFDGALLDEADLSDCSLQGASFDRARARRARFTVADLRGARMTRADLAGASLARADLRAADLSDSSLYEADLARIHGDGTTRYDRIQRTRLRIHPRRTPA